MAVNILITELIVCGNSFKNSEIYIGNDTSFLEKMRNMFFNESKYNERTFWMTQKVHEFINGILDN